MRYDRRSCRLRSVIGPGINVSRVNFTGLIGALCTSLLYASLTFSQSAPPKSIKIDSARISVSRVAIFSGVVVSGAVAVHYARYKPLWPDHYTSFRFHEDYLYARNQDKLLHFYGGVVGSVLSARSLSWAGYSDRDAALYGAATSFMFLTFMKIEDGHIDYLGFDRVDELANLLGAGYPVAQYYFPFLQSFTPKGSYSASHNRVVASGQVLPGFLEDHEGQKFWMGISVYDVLPKDAKRYWLPPVGLAVGYILRDLNTTQPYHETVLALDIDLRKLPGDSKFLKTLWEVLNFVHIPMPAVRLSPSVVWYGLYF